MVRVVLLLLALGAPLQAQEGAEPDAGAVAWRAGDRAKAAERWRSMLDQAEHAPERARLAYNLGNAAYRAGDLLEAVAWYTAALRLDPRDADTRANLDLARVEAGLEPLDRGDLSDTLARLARGWTRGEAEWIALAGSLLVALAVAGLAFRGTRRARRTVPVAVGVCVLAWVPLGAELLLARDDPHMVVDPDGAPARAEPATDVPRLVTLDAGTIVERIDALPGWTRVRADGDEVWVRDDALFGLDV